jgi:hypothetical protein
MLHIETLKLHKGKILLHSFVGHKKQTLINMIGKPYSKKLCKADDAYISMG